LGRESYGEGFGRALRIGDFSVIAIPRKQFIFRTARERQFLEKSVYE
jgi:hypothetical protein